MKQSEFIRKIWRTPRDRESGMMVVSDGERLIGIWVEQIARDGLCCISGRPLQSSPGINIIALSMKATWKFPILTDASRPDERWALAYVHDACMDPITGLPVGTIKEAIEVREKHIIYHAAVGLDGTAPRVTEIPTLN